VQTATIDAPTGDFRTLTAQIRDAGLLDRRLGYYAPKVGLTVLLYAIGWSALVIVGDSWITLGIAAFLGLMFAQLGFIGHDAGHQQIFRSRAANQVLGLIVGNLLIGMSFSWWVSKHNAHHAHPNEIGRDPDLIEGSAPPDHSGVSSPQRGISWVIARWPAELFFPLMLLRSAGLHVSGIKRLVKQRDRAVAVEVFLIAAHAALYLTAIIWLLSPLKALAFILVQQAVFSIYLGCSFAPNHKGMPIIDPESHLGFAQRQIITARNVAGGRLATFFLGGLNLQIEHHLFPSMPRPNLKRAQTLVRAFCLEGGFGYCEVSLIGSFQQALSQMRSVSKANMNSPSSTSD